MKENSDIALKYFLRPYSFIFLFLFLLCQCGPKEDKTVTQFPGKPEVPSSVKKEHEDLLETIEKISLFKDSTGHAAIQLKDLMQHHFKEEEDYVLPPLGLLPLLASGKLPEKSKEIIPLCEKLKTNLDHLDAEHQLITYLMGEMAKNALRENHPEVIAFTQELHKHAATEEELMFPSAILIGEYLKVKTAPAGN